MKCKILILMFFFLIIGFSKLYGQSLNDNEKEFAYGLIGGANLSNFLHTNSFNNLNFADSKSQIGWQAGILLRYRFNESLALATEILYQKQKFKYENNSILPGVTSLDFSVSNIQFPLLIEGIFPNRNTLFALYFGPLININVSNNIDFNFGQYKDDKVYWIYGIKLGTSFGFKMENVESGIDLSYNYEIDSMNSNKPYSIFNSYQMFHYSIDLNLYFLFSTTHSKSDNSTDDFWH